MTYRSLLLVLALAACSQSQDNAAVPDNSSTEEVHGGLPDATSNTPGESSGNASLPDDRTPLEEPNGPIDPKSAEAAGQIVQSFGALIEQSRWAEAEGLWGDRSAASRFTAGLKRNKENHIEIGKPGQAEGAAGSIYVTMPISLYGKNSAGAEFRRAANVVLRRVNDVPGSTAEQRRWHIERIDMRA